MSRNYTKNEIKSWLEVCFSKEDVKDIVIGELGHSEKGDGYLSDIVFVDVTVSANDGSKKDYNLALKCNRNGNDSNEPSAVKTLFCNEIHFYSEIFPAFVKFQLERGIEDPFDCVPKCYGSLISDGREIIVFENLSKAGYSVGNKKEPMTRNHINLVLKEYAKFHAISVAMKDQEKEQFTKLTEPIGNLFKSSEGDGHKMLLNFIIAVEQTYDLLQNDLDDEILNKWKRFGQQMKRDIVNMMKPFDGFSVVNHGDCWNNNFMFKTEDSNVPSKVSILDWQISQLGSPISDLSYFLFSCMPGKELDDLDIVLEEYHRHFSDFLKSLNSDPEMLYPRKQFFEDWKNYSKIGILLASMIMRVCTIEKEDAPDVLEATQSGNFADGFKFDVKNPTQLKNRMKYIVKYVAEKDLI